MWYCLHDPTFSRFSRTPTCDRQTDGQTDDEADTMTANTHASECHVGKKNVCLTLSHVRYCGWADNSGPSSK